MRPCEVEILLVEDDPDDVELTLHVIQTGGLASRVQVARDGEEALDFLFCRDAFSGPDRGWLPKLILLDLKLPKVEGLEVLRQIKGDPRTRTIPVVILSSSRQESDRLNGYLLGVNSHVQKPVDYDKFRATVEQLGLYWLITNQPPPRSPATSEKADENDNSTG